MKLQNGWIVQPTQGWRTSDNRLKFYRWHGNWRVTIVHSHGINPAFEDKLSLARAGLTFGTGLPLRELMTLACEVTGAQPSLTRAQQRFNSEYGVFYESSWLAIIEQHRDGWQLKPSSQMTTYIDDDCIEATYTVLKAAFLNPQYNSLNSGDRFISRQAAINHLIAVAESYPLPVIISGDNNRQPIQA